MKPDVRLRECRHGTFCYFPHDIYIGKALDWYGEYSEGEVELFEKLLKPGMVVIEVGANIGCHTVPLAKIVGETGAVIAFEPQRIIHQMLCANVCINGLLNVWTEQKAVGNPQGSNETIGVPNFDYCIPQNMGGVVLGDKNGSQVPLVSLDKHLPDVVPTFIKIDCESMELQVIKGAANMINKHRPVLYVENDRIELSSALIQTIMDFDYDLWWHTPVLYNPMNWRSNNDASIYNKEDHSRMVSSNMICTPKALNFKITGIGTRRIEDADEDISKLPAEEML